MTFEEWLIDAIGKRNQFDEGDTEEIFQKLGEESLEEELRKEEKAKLRRLRKNEKYETKIPDEALKALEVTTPLNHQINSSRIKIFVVSFWGVGYKKD